MPPVPPLILHLLSWCSGLRNIRQSTAQRVGPQPQEPTFALPQAQDMEFSTCPSHILGLNCWKSTGRLHLLQLTKFNKSLCSFCTPVDDYSEFSSHLQPHRAQQQLNFCTFSILSSLWRGAWMPQSCQDIIIRKKRKKSGIEAQR